MAIARSDEQVFPDVERVLYKKAPLVEVICQVRFPADLRIEKEPPADFQQRVRSAFPILDKQARTVLQGLPPEIAKAFEGAVPPAGTSTLWRFGTANGKRRLELTRDNLTLVCGDYDRWEEFYETFKPGVRAFIEVYEPAFVTRVGLRYQDLIRRSRLGLEGVPWHELLADYVLGELGEEGVRERAIEASRNLVLALPERGGKVRLRHGFAKAEGSDEECYLIDCDFFVERTEVTDVESAIEYLYRNARRYFRWCITDRLHEAMEPEPVRD